MGVVFWLVAATSAVAPLSPEVVAKTANDAAAVGAVPTSTQQLIEALPGPHPSVAGMLGMWAWASWMRRSDYASYAGPFADGMVTFFYYAAIIGTPFGFLSALWAEEEKQKPHTPVFDLDASVYLLDFKSESALTGQLKRDPEGRGVGWDFYGAYNHPVWGVMAGGALTFQESDIDQNDWVMVTSFFRKLDVFAGLDVARLLGTLTGNHWIARQQAQVRAGPSFFKSWVYVGDQGSSVTKARPNHVNLGADLVSGKGYELSGELDLDFGWLGGLRGVFQRGVYPTVEFPKIDGEQAALIALVGFDDLRTGDEYTWQKVGLELNIPFLGFAKEGTINLGGQLTRYENNKGSGVNNRGVSVGGSWRF